MFNEAFKKSETKDIFSSHWENYYFPRLRHYDYLLTRMVGCRELPNIYDPVLSSHYHPEVWLLYSQKQASQKGPLNYISPGAYLRNFTVFIHFQSIISSNLWWFNIHCNKLKTTVSQVARKNLDIKRNALILSHLQVNKTIFHDRQVGHIKTFTFQGTTRIKHTLMLLKDTTFTKSCVIPQKLQWRQMTWMMSGLKFTILYTYSLCCYNVFLVSFVKSCHPLQW